MGGHLFWLSDEQWLSYRCAHGSSCSRAFLHAAVFHRHRCDHRPGRIAFSADIGYLSFMSPAMGQPGTLTKRQSDALKTYNDAVSTFKSILGQRRAQMNSNQPLPNLPGQAVYLARNNTLSAYKDLTDALASKIGGPNRFGNPSGVF